MATLYISEYVYPILNQGGMLPAGPEPSVATQTVAIGGSSTASAAFNAKTNFVRLHTDSICSVSFGAAPTASATTARMAANTTEFFIVVPGQKVAVITNS